MIELFNLNKLEQLNDMIETLKNVGSTVLFELRYKFLAKEELLNYVSERLLFNKRYPVINANIKEIWLNGNNNDTYIFKYNELSSLLVNNQSISNFLLSNEDLVTSFYLKTKFHNNLPENIKEIQHNKYVANDIVSFTIVYDNNEQLEIGFYWYSDSLTSINYLQRASIINNEVNFSFESMKQTNNYFNSYALEKLVKCSNEYSYDALITKEDISNIKLMYVNLKSGSIFNNYEFIEVDILKLEQLKTVAFVFEVDEDLEINIAI